MVQYSINTVWYYRDKKSGKIYATKMLFSHMVKRLNISSLDLDIIGSICHVGNRTHSTV